MNPVIEDLASRLPYSYQEISELQIAADLPNSVIHKVVCAAYEAGFESRFNPSYRGYCVIGCF